MKRVLLASAALFTLTACQNMDALAPWIEQGNQAAKAAGYDTDSRLAGAVKETLSISSDRATSKLSSSGATDYFRGRTESSLTERYRPIIESSLRETGFYDQYRLYTEIGTQEALIRQDPVSRGSALIGTVFGGQD